MPAKKKPSSDPRNAASENAPGRLGDLPEELAERGRDVWLAGLGALATAEKEGARLFNTLVERGQAMEAEGKSRLGSAKHDLNARQKETAGKLEETAYGSVRSAMERLGVPTRAEVDALSNQVEALSQKLDAIAALLEARTSTPKVD